MKKNLPTTTLTRTTTLTHFGTCSGTHPPVFAVHPDVDIDDVLIHLSAAITSAFESNAQLCEMLDRPLVNVAWATWQSLEMCQALLEALQRGNTSEEANCDKNRKGKSCSQEGNVMNSYMQEVIDLHILIEASFAKGEGQIEAMLERFHPDFSMITPTGLQASRTEIGALFSQRAGSQPGLTIEVSDMETLVAWPGGAVIRYQETHRISGQSDKKRISTALFSREGESVLWRHLHETWAA